MGNGGSMLKINKEVVDAIIAHARKEAPLEACGDLAEKGGIVVAEYVMNNGDVSEEHYSLKPEEQFAVVRQMRTAGVRLRAIYHSHPRSEARPSEEDISLAYDPDISYVIISLLGRNESVRSFRIEEDFVIEEDVEIL